MWSFFCRYRDQSFKKKSNLPSTSDPNPSWFYIFINTLMSALRRNNYMPYNFWIRDIPGERFILILWVNGYFRTNLKEITPFVERAWGVHSPGSVSILGSFPFSLESTAEDKNSFGQTVASLIQPSGTVVAPAWHQRTFGGSQIRWKLQKRIWKSGLMVVYWHQMDRELSAILELPFITIMAAIIAILCRLETTMPHV